MTDLPLYLPDGIYLKSLVIDPEFSVLSETMQRAVVLIALSDDDSLRVDGLSVIELLKQTTNSGAATAVRLLSGVATELTGMLNAGDGLQRSPEKVVSSTNFDVETEGTAARVTLNIILTDNTKESTVIYQYE